MYWNYRLVRMTDRRWPDEIYTEMREVFYNEDNQPCAHTRATVCGDDTEGVTEQLKMMHSALGKPVLDAKEFVGTFKDLDEEDEK